MKSINKVLRILQVKRLARARNQEAPKQDTFWNSKPSREKYDITSSTKWCIKSVWVDVFKNTTNTSVLEKHRTRTPTSFVSVIPLQ